MRNDYDRGVKDMFVDKGVREGGDMLKDVQFAYNQGMVAQTEDRILQTVMDALSKTGKE